MCGTNIPSSFYEAKRKLRDQGLGYETIHACKYDCVLLRHPADGEGWKHFDSEFLDFALEPRNARLS